VFILPPRTSWLYRFAISLSSTQRYLVTFLFIMMCIVVWFYGVYQPFNARIEAAQQQTCISQDLSVEELTESIAALRNELVVQGTAPSSDELLTLVLGYLDRTGMVLEQCSVEGKAIHIQALGSYAQCFSFFDQLATSRVRLIPCDMRFTRDINGLFNVAICVEPA